MIVLSSCSLYPKGRIDNVEGKAEVRVDSETENVTGLLNDSIAVDAKVSVPSGVTWNAYTVKEREFTEEDAKRISDGSVLFITQEQQNRHFELYVSGETDNLIRPDYKELYPLDELESYSKAEALQKVNSLCQVMNIKISEIGQTIIALDKINAEKFRQESSKVIIKGIVDVDNKDGICRCSIWENICRRS